MATMDAHHTSAALADTENVTTNSSLHGHCLVVLFSEVEFVPWDNPHNVISAEVENVLYRVQNNMHGLLILIGGPANVINMAVFCKQGLSDRINLCLFSQSLADLLFLLVINVIMGEQLYLQFVSTERFGPFMTWLINANVASLTGFFSVSPVLSAIIAMERCYCVLRPLKFQSLMQTRTMAGVIVAVYVTVMGLCFIVTFRYSIACMYDPDLGVVYKTFVARQFYLDHQDIIDTVDSLFFGVGMPSVVMVTVIISTTITIVKLRQIVRWRAESSSSSLSEREIALTKMLIGISLLFVACVLPAYAFRFVWLFVPEMNSGRRHHNLYLSSLWLGQMLSYVNASFNFFVYYAMGSRYRETFWALWRRVQCLAEPERVCS